MRDTRSGAIDLATNWPVRDRSDVSRGVPYRRVRGELVQFRSVAAHVVDMTEITVTQLMTTKQLSDYLQIPVRTLEDWRSSRSGRGPKAIHLGNRVRYRLSTVDAWLESLESGMDAA